MRYKAVKHIETESRVVFAEGGGVGREKMGSCYPPGTFQLCKLNESRDLYSTVPIVNDTVLYS